MTVTQYIQEHIIKWLLEEGNQDVRYLALREFPLLQAGVNMKEEYSRLCSLPEIRTFLVAAEDGIVGNHKQFDLLYKGTVWYLASLVERGLDVSIRQVKQTVEYIIHTTQLPAGEFSMNWSPLVGSAAWTGEILRLLLMAGYTGDAVHKAVHWIVAHQRDDGGWLYFPIKGFLDNIRLALFRKSGSGLERDANPSISSNLLATISCGRALVRYNKKFGNKYGDTIQRAVEYVLSHQKQFLLQNEKYPRGYISNNDITLLGYPLLLQCDILKVLLFIAEAGFLQDPRTAELFNTILAKRNTEGSWNFESKAPGMIYGPYVGKQRNKADKWVTLQVYRLMKYMP